MVAILKLALLENVWLAEMLAELGCLPPEALCLIKKKKKNETGSLLFVTFSTSLEEEAKGHLMPVSFGEPFNHPSQHLQDSTF